MPVYSWRRRTSRHFGEVFVPYAEIEIQATDGSFQEFALQVDSGATVSLLKGSAADVLGIGKKTGRRIELTGVGEAAVVAYVHDLQTRIEEHWPPLSVQFAIAESENVPNLLGRLGVFDRLQIDFDSSLTETRVWPPWLSAADRRIWDFLIETEKHIQDRWNDVDLPNVAKDAAWRMLGRATQILAAAAGLAKLHREFAGPLMIRSLFELAAQFEYMMQDPATRGQQYLDYGNITRYLEQEAFLNAPDNPITRLLKASPQRDSGTRMVKAEFDRVVIQFTTSRGKLRKNWYGLQFSQLIEGLSGSRWNWKVEYDLWYRKYSRWLHSDPFSATHLYRPFAGRPSVLLVECYPYYARMLHKVSEKLILTREQFEFLETLSDGILA